jgi:hypothetical protein
MIVARKLAAEQTNGVDICVVRNEEMHNLRVPISRCIMNRSFLVIIYGPVEMNAT